MGLGDMSREGKMGAENSPGALQTLGSLPSLSPVSPQSAPILDENRELEKRGSLACSL